MPSGLRCCIVLIRILLAIKMEYIIRIVMQLIQTLGLALKRLMYTSH